jgi:hypothetical protein
MNRYDRPTLYKHHVEDDRYIAETKTETDPVKYVEDRQKRLAKFDKLYEENKDKIHMAKKVNHDMNYKKATAWINSHCDEASIEFSRMIIENTLYVSYGRFLFQLERVCESFRAKYKDSQWKIVLVVPGSVMKSNFWVSLLCYPFLKDMIYDIQFNITDVYNFHVYERSYHPHIMCVLCDDCAYTGLQISESCAINPYTFMYSGKPSEPKTSDPKWLDWNRAITDVSLRKMADIKKEHFCVALLIPFIGSYAYAHISKNPLVIMPKNAEMFMTFKERVDLHRFSHSSLMEFGQTFQYYSGVSAVYFDHKVSDCVSTFNKIYLLAPVFHCNAGRKFVPFIEGCDSGGTNLNVYGVYTNVEDDVAAATGSVCPTTFYKMIQYTVDGVIVNGTMLSSLLE